MSQTSNGDVVVLWKKVYGDLTNLLPQDFPLARDIPFSAKQKVGESYIEAVVLTHETGITLSSSSDAFELNPAVAGTVKQTTVTPYITVLPSIIPWGVMSRTVGGGEKAFFDATKWLTRNNLTSHSKFQEILRLYGRADALLGYVSYASQVYRGVSFTTGTGTLNGIAFTNGINAASKYILLAPGSFASGIWIGMEGMHINQVSSTGAIVASGKLVGVNSLYGYIQVDFTPVAASSTTSHRLCLEGQQSAQDYVGINYILNRSGSLFGIDNTVYSLFSGNVVNNLGLKLTLGRILETVANTVNKSGLEGDVDLYVNPRSFSTLATTEAGLRMYDSSYKPSDGDNGFESLTFYAQSGKITIRTHRFVKEGEAYGLYLPSWSRSGSCEVSFTVPGIGQEVIFPLQNQAGYAFRSYSDQYVFCHEPAKNFLITNINDESAT